MQEPAHKRLGTANCNTTGGSKKATHQFLRIQLYKKLLDGGIQMSAIIAGGNRHLGFEIGKVLLEAKYKIHLMVLSELHSAWAAQQFKPFVWHSDELSIMRTTAKYNIPTPLAKQVPFRIDTRDLAATPKGLVQSLYNGFETAVVLSDRQSDQSKANCDRSITEASRVYEASILNKSVKNFIYVSSAAAVPQRNSPLPWWDDESRTLHQYQWERDEPSLSSKLGAEAKIHEIYKLATSSKTSILSHKLRQRTFRTIIIRLPEMVLQPATGKRITYQNTNLSDIMTFADVGQFIGSVITQEIPALDKIEHMNDNYIATLNIGSSASMKAAHDTVLQTALYDPKSGVRDWIWSPEAQGFTNETLGVKILENVQDQEKIANKATFVNEPASSLRRDGLKKAEVWKRRGQQNEERKVWQAMRHIAPKWMKDGLRPTTKRTKF